MKGMLYYGRYLSREALIQNLEDAGCDCKMVEAFFRCLKENKREDQILLLNRHRKRLLEGIHREEKKVDCLDYLLYSIQCGQTNETVRRKK